MLRVARRGSGRQAGVGGGLQIRYRGTGSKGTSGGPMGAPCEVFVIVWGLSQLYAGFTPWLCAQGSLIAVLRDKCDARAHTQLSLMLVKSSTRCIAPAPYKVWGAVCEATREKVCVSVCLCVYVCLSCSRQISWKRPGVQRRKVLRALPPAQALLTSCSQGDSSALKLKAKLKKNHKPHGPETILFRASWLPVLVAEHDACLGPPASAHS